MRRLIRMAAWLYPAPWRERYGAEFQALLEDVRPAGRDVWDVLRGALIMQMTAWSLRKVMAMCGFAGLLVAGAIAYAMPANYVSTAVMRIAPMTMPEGTTPVAANRQMEERLQQMQTQILSRGSLAAIITRRDFDLYHKQRTSIPLEDIIQEMRSAIRIRPLVTPAANGSLPATAFTISYEYPNNFKAQAVVNELVSKFVVLNVTEQREKAQNLEVLDPASLPGKPFSPNRAAMLLWGWWPVCCWAC